jgi:hypothetical protein
MHARDEARIERGRARKPGDALESRHCESSRGEIRRVFRVIVMGSSDVNSVVRRDFHVWGTKNLYVVDGSVFPTSIGANPMQSIYTFAKIFADHVASGRIRP